MVTNTIFLNKLPKKSLRYFKMSNVTTEQKLQLVQQVRSRYHEDQYDMSNRERLLYGRSSILPEKQGCSSAYGDPYNEPLQPGEEGFTFFKLRFLLALFLAAAVIGIHHNHMSVAGITSEKIFQAISADYEDAIEAWVETISTTR